MQTLEDHKRENAYLYFDPRPDNPERFDQQESFYNSQAEGIAWMIGGNGAGTSEIAMAKVAKFILNDQEPPRKDTPFWIISDSYQQVCNALWKEKLYGHGHIPKSVIDWERIRWYKPNQNWPFEVPLRPWRDRPGKNWTLVFKSYEQGRSQMQAESIGGFCFSEQFPWGLLEEVMRGCREYSFRGNKIAEFTPVDPNLSIELEERINNNTVPDGWEIYRSNTECALEAGHVSQSWFEQFYGLVSDEMRETRLTGAFASFEGAIYQGFNPLVHLVGDETIDFPPNIHHRRSIDWGGGPSNAFCCLWGYRNGRGQWFIYDEYYSTNQMMTTVDHLCEVDDLHHWPLNNPHYGTTYADPSSPSDLRIAAKLSTYSPSHSNLWISPAANDVHEGIEHVRWLLKCDPVLMGLSKSRYPNLLLKPQSNGKNGNGKHGSYTPTAGQLTHHPHQMESQSPMMRSPANPLEPELMQLTEEELQELMTPQPRLFIHKERCPMLSRQIRTYRWMNAAEKGLNPADARREPLKKDDHTCTIATMPVFTSRGWVPIIDILTGDIVASQKGWSKVLCGATKTGEKRELVKVSLSTGKEIICTPDHRFLTETGMVPASHLMGKSLARFSEGSPELEIRLRQSSIAGSSGEGTQTPRTSMLDTSRNALGQKGSQPVSTEGFTKTFSGLLQEGGTSITETGTLPTIIQKTLNSAARQIIPGSIPKLSKRCSLQPLSGERRIRKRHLWSQRLPVTHTGQVQRSFNLSAVTAGYRLSQQTLEKTGADIAATNAEWSRERHSRLNARHAETSFSRIHAVRENFAAEGVPVALSVSPAGSDDVYCIATEDGTMVWDGGVLVSNCDALRYMVFSEAIKTGAVPKSIQREVDAKEYGVQAGGRDDLRKLMEMLKR